MVRFNVAQFDHLYFFPLWSILAVIMKKMMKQTGYTSRFDTLRWCRTGKAVKRLCFFFWLFCVLEPPLGGFFLYKAAGGEIVC
jgi:hypothetical protein